MDNETVSRSDRFGYIYRYDVAVSLDDDGPGDHVVRSVLVVWTTDCETWQFASYPTYQLPGQASK